MTPGSPPSPRRPNSLLWVLLAVFGLCAVCGAGAVAVLGLGVIAGASDGLGVGSPATREASPGAPGGFSLRVPPGFTPVSEGRWRQVIQEGDKRHSVDVIRLPSIAGLDDAQPKLQRLWHDVIVRDWPGAPDAVLPLRRFVANGARAWFSSAAILAPNAKEKSLVSLYLVEADDRLEPLVVLQEFSSELPTYAGAQFSWDTTHPLVEELIKGLEGSPVGLPLVDDAEVAGAWKYSSGASMDYVNIVTGSTSFSAVSSSTWYDFGADHDFTYRFSSANTNLGSTTFAGETDRGVWRVEHDLLIVEGEQRTRRFFIVGAGLGPKGQRVLSLMPEGSWSLYPGAIASRAEHYEPER